MYVLQGTINLAKTFGNAITGPVFAGDLWSFKQGFITLAHGDQMLEILASVQPSCEQPFQRLEHLVLNHVQSVSGCICVLLAWDEGRRKFVEQLRGLGVPLLVLVIVALKQSKPLDPGPMRDSWRGLEDHLRGFMARLDAQPRAILIVSGHWEASEPTVNGATGGTRAIGQSAFSVCP